MFGRQEQSRNMHVTYKQYIYNNTSVLTTAFTTTCNSLIQEVLVFFFFLLCICAMLFTIIFLDTRFSCICCHCGLHSCCLLKQQLTFQSFDKVCMCNINSSSNNNNNNSISNIWHSLGIEMELYYPSSFSTLELNYFSLPPSSAVSPSISYQQYELLRSCGEQQRQSLSQSYNKSIILFLNIIQQC